MDDLLEMGEQVLTVDIPDEVLERATTAEGQAELGYIALTLGNTAAGRK